MAYDESEVPEEVRDILAYMPRDMRQRVLADYETHYAPFLSMLAGWKGAVQKHYTQGQNAAIARLQEQFFPLGTWKFPAQGLAVPQRPPERTTEIQPESALVDPAGRPWLSCGAGWLQPTTLRPGQALQRVNNDYIVVLDIDYAGAGPLAALLERGQLAFVAAPEAFVAALEAGEWWALTPDRQRRPMHLSRYDGFILFEREMQAARLNQRHLDLWLPPFHPYSRKIVHLRAAAQVSSQKGPPDLSWLPEVREGLRFVGFLPRRDSRLAAALRAEATRTREHPLFCLNAVPVLQTAMDSHFFTAPFPRLGQSHAFRLSGMPDIFAAVTYHDRTAVPCSMARLPSIDPKASELDVEIEFAQSSANMARIKLYYGSSGQERADGQDAPSMLEMTPLRFQVPFRIVGGLNVNAPQDQAEWARTAWYHSVLRPPLLSEGDLLELLRQRRGTCADFLQFRHATREILHDPDEGDAHWRSYLWPSIVPRAESFDTRHGEVPATNYIPLIQCLRIAFARIVPISIAPDFLLTDLANYLASILSQHFVLSCFRVDGRVV